MPDFYTNTPRQIKSNPYLVRTAVHSPYIATGGISNLTEKERRARQQRKTASACGPDVGFGSGGGIGGGGYGFGPAGMSNVSQATAGNFFSAQISTDFLELPQSIRERRELYRHYYNSDELVAQAIDIHTELPLSKVRLAPPKPRTCPKEFNSPADYGRYILSRFRKMCDETELFQQLVTMLHHYWLDGTVAIWAEDSDVEIPQEVGAVRRTQRTAFIDEEGEPREEEEEYWEEKDTIEQDELAYYQKHYVGWRRIVVLPIDQVKITTFSYTKKTKVELIPTTRDRELVEQAKQGDPLAQEMVMEIPAEVRQFIEEGQLIPMGTNPQEGSFVYILHARKGADEEYGNSILNRCLRTLTLREKLRQAQTSIASRAMTPKRVVWAEGMSEIDTDLLRQQVDLALQDPDFSIVSNYEIHWEEMGARDRLLDLSTEYEQTERRLLAGLGVTESLMSGEALYSADRLKLEVMNNRYLVLRDVIQNYVDRYLFEPVARRMGFIEEDEWGQEVVIYPHLSFTRLPLRDSQDTFDAMLNLYQKGSLSVDIMLEQLNIDPDDTREKIERDMFTVNDPVFNEVMRSIYSESGRLLPEKTDVLDRISKYLALKMKKEDEGSGGGNSRFASASDLNLKTKKNVE